MEKPDGAYYYDEEAQLWVTNGVHDRQHYEWWLKNKVPEDISFVLDDTDLAELYATEYLAG